MASRKVIPQLDPGTPAYRAREERRAKFLRFCKQERWTLEHQLQALSSELFHADDRGFAISWLNELLEDLRDRNERESN